LSDGRLFLRRANGEIAEADASDRRHAVFLLALEETVMADPMRGLELLPPARG
jgi:hypothetical protein